MKRLLQFLAASLLSPAVAFVNSNDGWHMGGWKHMMWFGYGGVLVWITLLVLIGVVVYFILKSTKSTVSQGTLEETPMDILKKRYAKGEITKEEFEKMKRDL